MACCARARRRARPGDGGHWASSGTAVRLGSPELPRSHCRTARRRWGWGSAGEGGGGQARVVALIVAAHRDDRDRPRLLVDLFEEPDRVVAGQRVVRDDDVRTWQEREGPSGRPSRWRALQSGWARISRLSSSSPTTRWGLWVGLSPPPRTEVGDALRQERRPPRSAR